MILRRTRAWAAWAVMSLLLVVVGCGSSGTVTMKAPTDVTAEIHTPEDLYRGDGGGLSDGWVDIDAYWVEDEVSWWAEVDGELSGEPQPGEAGYPCISDSDCFAGFCIQTADGKLCTTTCIEECPFGWDCVLHAPSAPDDVYICVPGDLTLCRPCMLNVDCLAAGGDVGARCVDYGAAGSFCSIPCSADGECHGDYSCATVADVTGKEMEGCVLRPPASVPSTSPMREPGPHASPTTSLVPALVSGSVNRTG